MTFTAEPSSQLSFGDLCESDIFYGAYLRADASALRERTVTGSFLKKEFSAESLTSYIPVNPEVPALKAQEGMDFLLAHGAAHAQAVCLSDDCEIESRLGRRGQAPSGRLLFAPVSPLKSEEAETLTQSNLGRMGLGDMLVVELRRPFAVAAEDLVELLAADRLARQSLDDETQTMLAAWWAGYACRRGPLVSGGNAAKLARVLEAQGIGREQASATRTALTALATAGWRLEGRGLEAAGQRHDDADGHLGGVGLMPTLTEVREDLNLLAETLSAAQQALAALPSD